jgi:uncharacterized protein YbaR (Trm112 family)
MFIELIDILRCPREHDDAWLVASIGERDDRDIVSGTLGCPVCRAEYPIIDRVAVFGRGSPLRAPAQAVGDESDDDAAVRCAALLDLYDPGGVVVLAGSWVRAARPLLDLSPVSVLVVDPPPALKLDARISGIAIGDVLPLARGSARGIAIGVPEVTDALVASAAAALRPHGRLLAPVEAAVPAGIVERARDGRHWLGETEPRSAPVPLGVRRRG